MTISNTLIVDDFLDNPDNYVKETLDKPFVDIPDATRVFKGIQMVEDEEVESKLNRLLVNYNVVNNFIRQSPKNQEEPNYIHSDRNECDLIAILYLNKRHPKRAGTTIYENGGGSIVDFGKEDRDKDFKPSIDLKMKYNRLVAFPADLYHSRNIKENFGKNDKSRLAQVVFLKNKNKD